MLDKTRRQRAGLNRLSRVETLSELSVTMAHELSQPLAMILTNAEAAQSLLDLAPPNLIKVREILSDIVSANRRAAEAIRRLRGLLETRRQRAGLNRLSRVETLSVTLAHELSQPLAMILTNAEAAQSLLDLAPPNLTVVREILSDIVSADRRAAEAIRRLRGLLEHGKPRREEILLNDAIDRVLYLVRNEIDDQGVTVDLNLAPDLPPVQADCILIEQVLLNLLNNACEAVAGNPTGERRVSILARAHTDKVLVEVTDNGCGFPDPKRAFDAFFSTKPRGLGMGLAIVRSIVKRHGGRVWTELAPTRGATIRLFLPRDGAVS